MTSLPARPTLIATLGMPALLAAAVFFLISLISIPREGTIDPASIQPSGTGGWAATLPGAPRYPMVARPDSNDEPRASTLALFEDGKPLGAAHSLHSDIWSIGSGRYSHWGTWIIFSSSDNSNPKVNGRHYQVSYSVTASRSLAGAVAGLTGLVAAACFIRRKQYMWGKSDATGINQCGIGEYISWLLRARPISDKAFWQAVLAILGVGLVLRLGFLAIFGIPFTVPDSMSYLYPAWNDPVLPLSEVRTLMVPWLIAGSITVFHHPAGIIATYILLWLFGSLLTVFTLKRVFGLRLLGMLLLSYLSLTQKNLAFEFLLLSEHPAAVGYEVTLALMLLSLRGRSWLWPLSIAAAVLFSILVKPSALVLMPLIAVWTAAMISLDRSHWLKRLAFGLATVALVTAALLVNMAAFQQRFGSFAMSHFDGYNFFAQVGHLTVYDGEKHKEIKAELSEFLPLYASKYAARHDYQWNWLIYSAFNDELRADFGDKSPIRTVLRHLGTTHMKPANDVFRDLAVEAVKAHPWEYAKLTAWTTGYLLTGFSMNYGDFLSPHSLEDMRVRMQPDMMGWFYDQKWPDVSLRRTAQGGLTAWPPEWRDNQPLVLTYLKVTWEMVTWCTRMLSLAIYAFAAVGLLVLAIAFAAFVWGLTTKQLVVSGGQVRLRQLGLAISSYHLLAASLIGCAGAGYVVGVSLYCVSEPSRFLQNIQPVLVTFILALAALSMRQIRRWAIIFLRRRTAAPAKGTSVIIMTHKMKRLLVNAALLILGCILALGAGEVMFRIYDPLSTRLIGNKIQLPKNKVTIIENTKYDKMDREIRQTKNSLGFRGDEPPPGLAKKLSVIAVGGSTTECYYLSDGKTWPEVLGQDLKSEFPDLWVNNAGLDGHSTYGHAILLNEYIRDIPVKVITYLVGMNDIGLDKSNPYDAFFQGVVDYSKAHPDATPSLWQAIRERRGILAALASHSRLANAVLTISRSVQASQGGLGHGQIDLTKVGPLPMTDNQKRTDLETHKATFVPLFRKRLDSLIEQTRALGIEPVLITQPALWGYGQDPTTGVALGPRSGHFWDRLELYNDVTRQLGAERGVTVIDLARQMPKDSRLYYDWMHYTTLGAKVVAEIVGEGLRPVLINVRDQKKGN